MGVRLLHTADIHLDVVFNHSPGKGDFYRERIRQAFSRVIDLAREDHDLLIVAGDLFDNNRPYAATVGFARSELERAGIPVCLLAGNHDHLDEQSVYNQTAWPANVHVFQARGEQFNLPDQDLVVTGFPLSERPGDCIQDDPPALTRPARHHVAVLHGWVLQPDFEQAKGHLRLNTLQPKDVDYLALGHLHQAREQRLAVKAWYSGAPEPVQTYQNDYGVALSVELAEAGTNVVQHVVGSLQATKLEINMQGLDEKALKKQISLLQDANLILTVQLTGLRDRCPGLDVDDLQERLQNSFFSLSIRDQTQVSLSLDHIPESDRNPLIKEFTDLIRARLDAAQTAEEKIIIRQAYDLGLNELQGRRVV